MQPTVIKGIVHPKKMSVIIYSLTHILSQTCINFFLVLNRKYDILKNVGNQKLLVHIEFDSRKKS